VAVLVHFAVVPEMVNVEFADEVYRSHSIIPSAETEKQKQHNDIMVTIAIDMIFFNIKSSPPIKLI
jgi:hypothetical protein